MQKHQQQQSHDALLDSSVVDYSDNEVQTEILLRHYRNEARHDNAAFMQDYTADSVVHRVMDGTATTYYGLEGGRKSWDAIMECRETTSSSRQRPRIVQHVSIQSNHAKVVWKLERLDGEGGNATTATTTSPPVVVGTDWYTFDDWNHIATQTTVATKLL